MNSSMTEGIFASYKGGLYYVDTAKKVKELLIGTID
jgi:hypothetical protein